MALSIPYWAFALIPFLILAAALFWGAPAIALVSELIGMLMGKPFPARCARQISRFAVWGHVCFWILVATAGVLSRSLPFWDSEFVTTHQMLLILTVILPFFGTLALIAYDQGWKHSKEKRVMHVLLGCVANVPVKYGYWGLVAVFLLFFRDTSPEAPFLPPWQSSLWPLFGLWLPLSLSLAAGLGMSYLLLRRNADDWGRDYYRYAAPFLGKWLLASGVMTLGMLAWLYVSLKGVFNLSLPQIFYAGIGAILCLILAMLLAVFLCTSENPMRMKGSMLGILAVLYLHCGLLLAAILETLNRYVPGWSVPTFMPEIAKLLR